MSFQKIRCNGSSIKRLSPTFRPSSFLYYMVPKPTGSEETFHIDAVPPEVTPRDNSRCRRKATTSKSYRKKGKKEEI